MAAIITLDGSNLQVDLLLDFISGLAYKVANEKKSHIINGNVKQVFGELLSIIGKRCGFGIQEIRIILCLIQQHYKDFYFPKKKEGSLSLLQEYTDSANFLCLFLKNFEEDEDFYRILGHIYIQPETVKSPFIQQITKSSLKRKAINFLYLFQEISKARYQRKAITQNDFLRSLEKWDKNGWMKRFYTESQVDLRNETEIYDISEE